MCSLRHWARCVAVFWIYLLTGGPAVALCLEGDCDSGIGANRYDTGDVYVGQFNRRLREGFGTYYWANGTFTSGVWIGGKRNFLGLDWDGSRIALKLFKDSKEINRFEVGYDAKNKMTVEAGALVNWGTGCKLGDCQDGFGVKADGVSFYQGFFVDGRPHGWGIEVNKHYGENDPVARLAIVEYRNGINWENGLFVIEQPPDYELVYGAMVRPPNLGQGCIAGDCVNGMGVYSYNNAVSVGLWIDKKLEGFATYFWENDGHFVGLFQDGKRQDCGFHGYEEGFGAYRGFVKCGGSRFQLSDQEVFRRLVSNSGGSVRNVGSAREVAKMLDRMIVDETERFADILLLIDKTGSMRDDIDTLRSTIQDTLWNAPFKSSFGAAFFGDREHDDNWYQSNQMTQDPARVLDLINRVSVGGGGNDKAESAYDAAFRARNEMDWATYSDRKLIIITDAPPKTGSATNHSEIDVMNLAKKKSVELHLIEIGGS